MRARSASSDRPRPFTRTRRREVAWACSFGPRTVAEIARQLATDAGSLTTVLTALVAEGVLDEVTVPHAEGRAYVLLEEWRDSLMEAIGSEAPLGLLDRGQRILVVGGRDAATAARAAAAIAGDPVVLWAVRIDGPARLLVAARAETPGEQQRVDRLEATIAALGVECFQFAIGHLLSLADLLGYAKMLNRPMPPPPALAASPMDG
jgi:hypothetical protein